jgi:hypothetical protein
VWNTIGPGSKRTAWGSSSTDEHVNDQFPLTQGRRDEEFFSIYQTLPAIVDWYNNDQLEEPLYGPIVNAARYLMRSMWEPTLSAFRYTSCPQSRTARELNAQILEGVGYAWRLSGDQELRHALLAGLSACLTTPHHSTTPPDGKDISSRMRSMPFIMVDIVNASRHLSTT